MNEHFSHYIASLMLSIIDDTLKAFDLPRNAILEDVIYTTSVIIIACLLGWLMRLLVMLIIGKVRFFAREPFVVAGKVNPLFTHLGHLIMPVLFLTLIPFAFLPGSATLKVLMLCGTIYLIIRATIVINSILSYMWLRYDRKGNIKNHPLKGLLQISKGIMWLIAIIFIGSALMGRSPFALLTGLGALSAVMMLVFKDSILGFVAGLQLSLNDSLRVGDWITVPGTEANGTVEDVSLTVVRVRNFDNTLVMLPPYSLISNSFRNYRGMNESGMRRITLTVNIDGDSVTPTTDAMLLRYRNIRFMDDYIAVKIKQRNEGKEKNTGNPDGLVNGSLETNLGLFRAYFKMYLGHHPDIAHTPEGLVMIIPGQPVGSGIPFQIYCFAATTRWVDYESIVAEIVEHLYATLPQFDLYAFEGPSGRDTVNQGLIAKGVPLDHINALPSHSTTIPRFK